MANEEQLAIDPLRPPTGGGLGGGRRPEFSSGLDTHTSGRHFSSAMSREERAVPVAFIFQRS